MFELGEEKDSRAFPGVAKAAEWNVLLFGDGGTLADEAGAAVPMTTGGQVWLFRLRQTHRTLGRCRARCKPKLCVAVLQEVEPDIRHIRRIDRHLVANLNRDSPHARPGLRDQLRIPIGFALDASSKGRILDLHVCDDGAHIRAGKDVHARQGHRLLEKGKHVRHNVSGGA